MRQFVDRYGIAEGRSLPGGGISGIAIPFNASDQRPGIAFNDEGELLFFDYKVYGEHSLDAHIAAGLPLVQFQFAHGGRQHDGGNSNPLASIPIGRIEQLEATPAALLFSATFNATALSKEVQVAVGRGELTELSAGLMVEDFELDTDADGKHFVRITQARVLDISIVDHGQFPQARILEHLALDVPEGFAAAVPDGQSLVGAVQHYAAPISGDKPLGTQILPRATSTNNGPGAGEMIVSQEAWGAVWAALNDANTEIATLRLGVDTRGATKGGSS